MRIAAIDIGTNSTLLTVADTDGVAVKPVFERCEITRLGRGVSSTKTISAEGLAILEQLDKETKGMGTTDYNYDLIR